MGFLHQNLLGHLVKMLSPGSAPAPWKRDLQGGRASESWSFKSMSFLFLTYAQASEYRISQRALNPVVAKRWFSQCKQFPWNWEALGQLEQCFRTLEPKLNLVAFSGVTPSGDCVNQPVPQPSSNYSESCHPRNTPLNIRVIRVSAN